MKLRCTHNSIRLRLRKSDISQLIIDQKIRETIGFGAMPEFSFTIALADVNKMEAKHEKGQIIVIMPEKIAMSWINSNEVGIEETIDFKNGQNLELLIEKDFPCIDRPHEDKSDTFFELADKGENC